MDRSIVFILLHENDAYMILRNISLKSFNTFGLDYRADKFLSIRTEDELITLQRDRQSIKNPLFILGGGSNVLLTEDFKGTILHPDIKGITIEEEHKESVIVSSGAGIIWDKLVEWCVENNLGGLENLSYIPGQAGASAVQNIGAYGIEVKDFIVKVRAVSLSDGSIKEFTNNDCRFSYRNSIFKSKIKGRYLITRVFYKLSTKPCFNLEYGSLKEELREAEDINLKSIRKAIINIRKSKLPDPDLTGNAGSFFKNPLVNPAMLIKLRREYPDIPSYTDPTGSIKLAAGWLIDRCGWKGKRLGEAGVHDKQALVIINHGNAKGIDIYNLSEKIRKSVIDKFGIDLEREVEIVGAI